MQAKLIIGGKIIFLFVFFRGMTFAQDIGTNYIFQNDYNKTVFEVNAYKLNYQFYEIENSLGINRIGYDPLSLKITPQNFAWDENITSDLVYHLKDCDSFSAEKNLPKDFITSAGNDFTQFQKNGQVLNCWINKDSKGNRDYKYVNTDNGEFKFLSIGVDRIALSDFKGNIIAANSLDNSYFLQLAYGQKICAAENFLTKQLNQPLTGNEFFKNFGNEFIKQELGESVINLGIYFPCAKQQEYGIGNKIKQFQNYQGEWATVNNSKEQILCLGEDSTYGIRKGEGKSYIPANTIRGGDAQGLIFTKKIEEEKLNLVSLPLNQSYLKKMVPLDKSAEKILNSPSSLYHQEFFKQGKWETNTEDISLLRDKAVDNLNSKNYYEIVEGMLEVNEAAKKIERQKEMLRGIDLTGQKSVQFYPDFKSEFGDVFLYRLSGPFATAVNVFTGQPYILAKAVESTDFPLITERGKNFVESAGLYAHAGIDLTAGITLEANNRDGVCALKMEDNIYLDGAYRFRVPLTLKDGEMWGQIDHILLFSQGYDYLNIAGQAIGKTLTKFGYVLDDPNRWICSELVDDILKAGGANLGFITTPSPNDLWATGYLDFEGKVVK